MSLRKQQALMLIAIFALLAIIVSAFQIYQVDRLVIQHATNRMRQNIQSAWQILDDRQKRMEIVLTFLAERRGLFAPDAQEERGRVFAACRERWNLDLLRLYPAQGGENGFPPAPGEEQSFVTGFAKVSAGLPPVPRSESESGQTMLLYAVRALRSPGGELEGLLTAAIDLAHAEDLVDNMMHAIFDDRFHEGQRVGTATIFMDTERITTTVLKENGERAVGTHVSEEVARQTLKRGVPWSGRAWVVDAWYLSRYDPIRDHGGNIIGMLYIGELEEIYRDIQRRNLLLTISLVTAIMGLALWLSYRATARYIRQIEKLEESTQRFTEGDYSARVRVRSGGETARLADSFNRMARTIEEERKLLVDQKEQLERFNAHYMEMLGFVTHEWRGSLGAALLNVKLLKEGEYGELRGDQAEGLELVENTLTWLEDISSNYLQLSRIEKGELIAVPVTCHLNEEIIDPVLADLKRAIEERGMIIDNRIEDARTVYADAGLLRIVYQNLISNAVKYGRKGGRVTLDCVMEEKENRLSIANEGKPVPPDKLPALFQQFQRYDVAESTGRKGAGLGLFIVKQIINAHHGDISVTSDAETGTVFTFTLPRE
jgi:signal transduction histidine kinase